MKDAFYNIFNNQRNPNSLRCSISGLTSDWNRTFTGQVLDNETGLMLYRMRYYHTTLGRFMARDPIGYDSADINIYRYVFNSSTINTDFYGLSSITCHCTGRFGAQKDVSVALSWCGNKSKMACCKSACKISGYRGCSGYELPSGTDVNPNADCYEIDKVTACDCTPKDGETQAEAHARAKKECVEKIALKIVAKSLGQNITGGIEGAAGTGVFFV